MNNGVVPSTVLIVDDVPLNRKLQQTYLDSEGYNVMMASDGLEALEKIKQQPPDLVLLDVMMPRMNGFEVCQNLKDDDDTRFIPIILVIRNLNSIIINSSIIPIIK